MPRADEAAVRRALTSIDAARSDTARAKRMALLRQIPPTSRVATILEATGGSVELRRVATLVIAKLGGRGKAETLKLLLLDPDPMTRTYAAQAMSLDAAMARGSIAALGELVELELGRTRHVGALRPALQALGIARTPPALAALLAITPPRFRVPAYRADWLSALAQYRSPRVVRAITPFVKSKVIRERAAALVGLVRNADDAALRVLREAMDVEDFFEAREVARQAHHALGTKMVFNPSQLAALKRWWDRPNDLAKRVKTLQRAK